ncbi:hypothetical protein AVEN_89748-1 [Araneus ventricosus]|uniref:DUF4817 domain-containing protein n=1 Tax=Araneus ventricosus TaxID=182803 RepID=A0A4Y2J7F9_ARAVE|nr:hypothetical protein AVEN_89748-1 [Araneus ventricosus]
MSLQRAPSQYSTAAVPTCGTSVCIPKSFPMGWANPSQVVVFVVIGSPERSVPLLRRERRLAYRRKRLKPCTHSIEQRVFLVLEYHRLKESPTATRRSFQARFNVPKGPDAKTIRTLFAKFQRTGSVTDDLVGNVGRQQTAVTPENVATVSGIIQQNPMSSVRRIASETGLKRSSTQKILRKRLHMFPFKIQTHQAHTRTSCATKG